MKEEYTENLEEIANKAEAVVKRILADNSELAELWDEDGVNEVWHSKVEDLLKRVKS